MNEVPMFWKVLPKVLSPDFVFFNLLFVSFVPMLDGLGFFGLLWVVFFLVHIARGIFSVWDDEYESKKRLWATLSGTKL